MGYAARKMTLAQVEIQTREDAWALRLIETIQSLRSLTQKGMAREVYVFGKLQVT